jgi:23S rRNA (uracil1939-C5)-methyltransferase
MVIDLTSGGQGVVKHPSGQTVFVSGVWLNERARFKVVSKRGRVGFAELVEFSEQSRSRRAAPCQHHGVSPNSCGACPWMFVEYDAQLQAKQRRVASAMSRFSIATEIQEIWASPLEFGYRNRAQLKTNGRQIGFVESQTNNLAPVEDCLVLDEHNRHVLNALVDKLPNSDWRPIQKQKWLTLNIDESVDADSVSINSRLPFHQANHYQNTKMREWISEKLRSVRTGQDVLELFCGSGNFTSELSKHGFENVYAVEGDRSAIQALKERHLKNVTATCLDLFDDESIKRLQKFSKNCGVLFLDPPRNGFKLVQQLLTKKHKIRDVFYVSCDLATFSRDLAVFLENGFKVLEIQPLDQFPQTPHIELLCHLKK